MVLAPFPPIILSESFNIFFLSTIYVYDGLRFYFRPKDGQPANVLMTRIHTFQWQIFWVQTALVTLVEVGGGSIP